MTVVINFPAAGGGGGGGSGGGGSSTPVSPTPWDASTNTPTITSGVAPANTVSSYIVTNAGITTVSPSIDGITSVRQNDVLVYSAGLSKWIRYAGTPITVAVAGPLTLVDAYNDCFLVCSGSPTITINTGLMAGFGCQLLNNWTPAGSATFTDDQRVSGNSGGPSTIQQKATDTYTLIGSKT